MATLEAGDASLILAQLLDALGVARHAAALAAEHVACEADLRLLNTEDCKELGFSIGERNRVAEWAGTRCKETCTHAPTRPEMLRSISRSVHMLEEQVLERESWVAASVHTLQQRELKARRRRGPAMRVQTRVGPAQVKAQAKKAARKRRKMRTKAKPKAAVAVLTNALFANAGSARRIGFAIDISGSMGAGTPLGVNRLEVVKRHLKLAMHSMEGVFNAAFNIVTFDNDGHNPMGGSLAAATWAEVKRAESVVESLQPGGGNGGEAACLLSLLKMRPQAIFFLGDGGWAEEGLINAAHIAKRDGVVIHSIAFFTSGGGLPQIAEITGGTYREINGEADLEEQTAKPKLPPKAAVISDASSDESTDSDAEDDFSAEEGESSSSES